MWEMLGLGVFHWHEGYVKVLRGGRGASRGWPVVGRRRGGKAILPLHLRSSLRQRDIPLMTQKERHGRVPSEVQDALGVECLHEFAHGGAQNDLED